MIAKGTEGSLLVLRHGYLIYERYFGWGNRMANPNLFSIAKMFTSTCCGIMLEEHPDKFPDGLHQKVITQEWLPEAFPLQDSRLADVTLGNLLTMTSGLQAARYVGSVPTPSPSRSSQYLTAIVHGENVSLPEIVYTDTKATPTKCGQFTRPKGIGHVKPQEEPVSTAGFRQYRSQLIPGQNLFVLWPEIFRDLQLSSWIFDQELLLDHFVKDGLEVGTRLFDSVLRIRASQAIDMRL